ncbi:MAG: nickel-binding protein [Bacteroidales bacterium]
MPLFMDFHKDLDVTVEDVKGAHMSDLSVQSKYNVRNLQYWINEEAGTMFCLMEAPDEESCAKMHEESHGNLACAIQEVDTVLYEMIIGSIPTRDQGAVKNDDGSIDTGYRFIMMVQLTGQTNIDGSLAYRSLRLPRRPKSLIREIIGKHQGGVIDNINDDNIISVFKSSTKAVRCALKIQKEFMMQKDSDPDPELHLSLKIGIAAGQPLTENDGFYEETIRKARYFTRFAGDGKIKVSSFVSDLCDMDGIIREYQDLSAIEILDRPGERFLMQLMDITESIFVQEEFSIERLCMELGISRPQLYRKITSLTGKAPNDWIRDLRLERAFQLLRIQHGNVSEIAYEAGFNNLSYFSKCFQKKFGLLPSQYLNISLSASLSA